MGDLVQIIDTFFRKCSHKYKPYFIWEMATGHVLSCCLKLSSVCLECKSTRLKERSKKPLTGSELSSVKSSAQMHEFFEGVKHSFAISISHSLLSFESFSLFICHKGFKR